MTAAQDAKMHGTLSSMGASAVERGDAVTLCARGRVRYVSHIGAVPLRVAYKTAERLGIEVCATCAKTWPGSW